MSNFLYFVSLVVYQWLKVKLLILWRNKLLLELESLLLSYLCRRKSNKGKWSTIIQCWANCEKKCKYVFWNRFDNRHFSLVDFVFPIQIMWQYLRIPKSLRRVHSKDCVRAWKCLTLKDNTLLGVVTWSALGKRNRPAKKRKRKWFEPWRYVCQYNGVCCTNAQLRSACC